MGRFGIRAAVLATLLGTLAGVVVPAGSAGEVSGKFKVGDTAPDFALQDTAGRSVRLSSFAGKNVVLLAFWSLRCGACLQEMPHLNRIHKSLGSRGVRVISVVTDGVDASATVEIMKEVGSTPDYPVLVDPDFAVSDTYTSFVVPHTLVIDRTGVVRYVHTGFKAGDEKQLEAALDEALGS